MAVHYHLGISGLVRGCRGWFATEGDDVRRYVMSTRVATAAAVVVGLATFALAGPASGAASVSAVHDLPGEYNISGAGSLACPPGGPIATATCYMVGETGTFAYNATSSTNVVVPVTDGGRDRGPVPLER